MKPEAKRSNAPSLRAQRHEAAKQKLAMQRELIEERRKKIIERREALGKRSFGCGCRRR